MSENGGPFKKGDPRINRKGRPKSFDALRELAQQIAHEEARTAGKEIVIADKVVLTKGEQIIVNGHIVTVTEMIMRQWAQSKDVRLVQAFIQYAYGKVPDVVKLETDHVKAYLSISPDDWDDKQDSTTSTLQSPTLAG